MDFLRELADVASIDDAARLTSGVAWREYLAALTARGDDGEALRRAVAVAKNRLSPESACPELASLKAEVYAGGDEAALRPKLKRIAELRAALPLRDHERLFGRLETEVGQALRQALAGKSGYSNRARRARDLFTQYAGRTRIADAPSDRHGNAAGAAYDLGVDGAFEGRSVHVLHLYHGEGFDFKKPTQAFERKGLRVERRTKPGDDLAAWLADAEQLWLISAASAVLKKEHIAAIADFRRRGGGLYIWGDNDPYYVDANNVLASLFGPDLKMTGNVHGAKVVGEITPARVGFKPHLVTTGLERLFEGITIASLDEAVCAKYGFEPLLYGSAGNLVTVVRDRSDEGGAVMIDGAFTRLYCQWDEAGSARYVCNAACFLAATSGPAEEAPEEAEALGFDLAGAYRGACDLTGESPAGALVMSVEDLSDPLANTTDFVLTDPLSAGAGNEVFSGRVYAEEIGRWAVDNGSDPFTKRPVIACLPLVDLGNKENLREFTNLLCKLLMDGKYLPTAARLLFFAVVDRMRAPGVSRGRREAWDYLYRQGLRHFTSTPELDEMGRKMPLLDAMAAYFSAATPEMTQVRRSFTTVGLIGRTLLREGRADRDTVRAIGRRSLVKSIVADAVASEKASPGTTRPALEALVYDNFHGLPRLDGARLVADKPAFARYPDDDRRRLERAVESPLLTAEEQTAVLHALTALDLRQYTADSAIEKLLAESPSFRGVWRSGKAGDVRALLNARFAAYQGIDEADPHRGRVPPFATTLGPSVYRCVCGETFGDPDDEVTDESVAAMAKARAAHFAEAYGSDANNWYPAEGTRHYNLHRAVQRVVAEQYPEATELEEGMVAAVAAYLGRDGKGFLCDPKLESNVRAALASYLGLRREGRPHPEGLLTLRRKAEHERASVYGLARAEAAV